MGSKVIMAYGYIRGHLTCTENGQDWFYEDTKETANFGHKERPCKKCGKLSEDGADPCIGMLPDVEYACCGHGIEGQDYVFTKGERMSLAEYFKRNPK